jgi:O-antigen ligase
MRMMRRVRPIAPPSGVPQVALGAPRDRHWDLLLACVAVYLATSVGRLHQLFPALLPLKPVLVSATLSVALYLLQQSGPRGLRWIRAPTTTYVLLLLLWMALSVPGALHQGSAFSMLVDNFVKTVALYILVVGSVRGFRDVQRLAFIYFSAAVVFAVVVVARFQVGGSDWRLGSLYYYDANDFATFAVSALPLGYYVALHPDRLHWRLIGALGLVPLVVAFIWSGSRGGFVALLAMMAFFLFRYTAIRARWRMLGAAVIVTALLTIASDRYWTQMTTMLHPDEDYNSTAENGRQKIWRRGVGYMLSHPLLGVGADNFSVAEGTISPRASLQQYGIGIRWNAAHNSFVQVGAELGIPGLVLLLAVIGSALRLLRRAARLPAGSLPSQRGPPQLAQALMASLIGLVVGAFFLSLAYSEMLYTLVALAVALAKAIALEQRAAHGLSWDGTGVAPSRPLPLRLTEARYQ